MSTEVTRDAEELAIRLYSAVVSDALDAAGSYDRIVSPRIGPVAGATSPLVGRAATARAVPVDGIPERPYAMLLESVDRLRAGDVLVIANDGESSVSSAVFGGLLATAARARGAVGCVVDGAVRDSRELQRLRFPTFATGCCPADSMGRDEVVEFGQPICCGGVEVEPGELVIADRDGVVIVPNEVEREVVDHALRKVAGESEMKKELAEGIPAVEAFAKYGIL